MPQASAYLPDENDSTSNDEQLDNSKPETWPLLLPSAIPKHDRSPCYKGVVETEQVLRLAQLQDGLVDLKRFRRALRNLRLYFKTNLAGEGQKTQTKSRTVETGVNSRIKRSVWRYRTAHHAHLELDPTGDWKNEYRELRDEDNRGPLKDAEGIDTGDGRYAPSWIWTTASGMVLPGEETAAEQQEINETARHEWMTCRARADRWAEEVELLQEEMRRVLVYLEWKSTTWLQRVGIRTRSCAPDIQRGIDAYARRQAAIHREIAISFASQWVPYLNTTGCKTAWVADLPWISEALSRKTKLGRWIPAVPTDTPHAPTTDVPSFDSAGGPAMVQEPLNPDEARSEGGAHSDGTGDDSDGDDEEEGSKEYRGYDHPDYDNEDYDDGDYDGEGHDEEDCDDEGDNDGTETDGEFGFEYDDEYMS